MNERLITVKEFAKRAGISPQAVYKAIKSGRLQPAKRDGKRVYLLSTDINKIKPLTTDNQPNTTNNNQEQPQETNQNQPETGEEPPAGKAAGQEAPADAETLRRLVDMLQAQLDTKDKQIMALTEALTEAQKSIRAAQALHAGTIQTQLIEGGEEAQKEEQTDPAADPPKEKKGFFRRLFGG